MMNRRLAGSGIWFRQKRSSVVFCFLLLILVLYIGWQWRTPPNPHKDERRRVADDGSRASNNDGRRASKRQFQFINRGILDFDDESRSTMQSLVARKAPARDPQLIKLVQRLLDPPPTEGTITLSRGIVDTPQSKEVDDLLKQKRHGFFVECGAFDGERSSNSLPLESSRQWTGVLIEANPYLYSQILGKNRNVFSLNACLSPYEYAAQLEFESSKGHIGRVVLKQDGAPSKSKEKIVPCFPLETILLALNRTQIDYLSLDVEGVELDVLKTIPFDRIDIEVLTVEFLHGSGGKEAYKSFMEGKGFRTHKELEAGAPIFVADYVFVKKRDA